MIRVPKRADQDIVNAFNDVEQELGEIDKLAKENRDLRARLDAIEASLSAETVRPAYEIKGDTIFEGDVRIENNLHVRGSVHAPFARGQINVFPPSIAPTGTASDVVATSTYGSGAQRTICVNGSLSVLNALQADEIYCRSLIANNRIEGTSIYCTTATFTNASGAEEFSPEYSFTIKKDMMKRDGDVIRVHLLLSYAQNTNSKVVKFYLGSQSDTMLTTTASVANNIGNVDINIYRVSSTTSAIYGYSMQDAASQATTTVKLISEGQSSVDFSVDQLVRFSLTGTAASDMSLLRMNAAMLV